MAIFFLTRYLSEETVEAITREYTFLEYIESSGTQYIDTGFMPNQDTRVKMDAQVRNLASTNIGAFFFGSGYPIQQYGFEAYIFENVFCGVYNGTQSNGSKTFSVGQRVSIDFNKNTCNVLVDKTSYYSKTFTYASFTSSVNLCLFQLPRQDKYYGQIYVYSCTIYDNGTVIRDYVPCKKKDGTVGLLDLVHYEFYEDTNGGSFIAGPEIDTTVNTVDWIESTGTQYIDTGIIPNANTRAVCDFQLSSVDSTNRAIFGVVGQFSFRKYSDTVFRTNGANNVNMSTSISMTARHTVDKTATLTTVDETYSASTTAATCTYPLFVFAYNNGTKAANYSFIKLYSMKIYDGDTLVKDYIPCLSPTGVACLYDKVAKKYKYNAGTDIFYTSTIRPAVSSWSVETVSGASYGFALNSSNYYESQNQGKASTAAVCKVVFNMVAAGTATFSCINYAESNYDFGILGTLDATLGTTYTEDSSNVQKSFKGSSSSSIQTVTYTVPAGEHYVYVKYRKDGSVDSNNDSLQFTVTLS
jgi:hypothetical protein